MVLTFWLYVSRSTIPPELAPNIVGDLVRGSQLKNKSLAVTGTLLFSGGFFSQLLEGPPAELMSLRSVILDDERHEDVRTIAAGRTDRRRFGGWSLAFSGTSIVAARVLQRAWRCTSHDAPIASSSLLQLMGDLVNEKG